MPRNTTPIVTDGGQYTERNFPSESSVDERGAHDAISDHLDFFDADERRLSELPEVDVRPSTVAGYTTEQIKADDERTLADHLSALPDGPTDERVQQTVSLVEACADAGHSPGAILTPYMAVFDQILDSVFAELEDGLVPEDAKACLQSIFRVSMADFRVTVDTAARLDGQRRDRTGREADIDASVGTDELLDTLPIPAFIVDADHRVIGWNDGSSYLLQMDEAEVLGEYTAESIKKGSSSDKTLADKVIDAPDSAHEEYDVDRVETPYTECLVYEDT
ncbi:MAG: PAS domain-containing protein, partial [Haloarculaceae archaeon]